MVVEIAFSCLSWTDDRWQRLLLLFSEQGATIGSRLPALLSAATHTTAPDHYVMALDNSQAKYLLFSIVVSGSLAGTDFH